MLKIYFPEFSDDIYISDNCDKKSYVPRQITFVGELPAIQKMCRY